VIWVFGCDEVVLGRCQSQWLATQGKCWPHNE